VDANDLSNGITETNIPTSDRVFVGGDQNLRGFPRKGIDNQGLGYLTFLYLGFELRLIEELPYRLQPFLLWDLGQTGNKRYTVDPTLFISEGIGLRWLSPFGTLRGSIARGRVLYYEITDTFVPEQWVYFISFGQEF
jgi:translocation and assembly module TamA